MGSDPKGLGRRGEEEAVRLLKANGYRILGRNVRARFGEIDVVARDGPVLCFVEIKARSSLRFGWPEEGVHPRKQWQLTRLAQWYLKAHRCGETPVRFDVVSLLLSSEGPPARTRLIKNAFDAA
ncbi:MAG: YraN family protein [Candidatus Omnitrophica bacterium]|nr:YraN family protein [Candidatus Omnitrophota bacterium]